MSERPASVLVVDDLPANVDLMSRRLERSGLDVLAASDGPTALDMLQSHAVDLVFWALDLKYPLTAEGAGPDRPALERVPPWQKATWTFPARGNKPPVTLKWCHGNMRFDELETWICLTIGPLPYTLLVVKEG